MATSNTKGKLSRDLFATFMNVTPGASSPTYEIMGDGITEMSVAYNPQTEEEHYIHQKSGSSEVTGYRPTAAVAHSGYGGDPVFEFVDDLRLRRAVLADAYTDIVNIYMYYDATGTPSGHVAERQNVSVQFDDYGGAGGESIGFDYTLLYRGDPDIGTWDGADKKFTATTRLAGTTGVMGVTPKAIPLNINVTPADTSEEISNSRKRS